VVGYKASTDDRRFARHRGEWGYLPGNNKINFLDILIPANVLLCGVLYFFENYWIMK